MIVPALRPCRLFIFDLDGTLIDSRADIAGALSLALARLGMPGLTEAQVADFVGEGMQRLVERTLREITGHPPTDQDTRNLIALFREEYGLHLLDQTCLYPSVREALDRLAWASFAVVTNKPEAFSRRILDGLGVGKRFVAIFGGDSMQKPKPDPEAILKAMNICRVGRSETAMVGDSAIDIQAGKAAGVTTCGVTWGFRPGHELEASGCDLIIKSLIDLTAYFRPPDP
jgi:phosphoglycolate phosphatase